MSVGQDAPNYTLFPYTALFRSSNEGMVPPCWPSPRPRGGRDTPARVKSPMVAVLSIRAANPGKPAMALADPKSTRLNSSHGYIPYAVFGLIQKSSFSNVHGKRK